jgi:hypothetical protein
LLHLLTAAFWHLADILVALSDLRGFTGFSEKL